MQIDNEDELLRAMNAAGNDLDVQRVDLALIDSFDQLRVIADSEILVRSLPEFADHNVSIHNIWVQVAMHGAALTYPMYMPAHGAVIEFWPKTLDMWRCFEHIATMSGLFYQRWENPDPSRFRND